MFEDPKVKQIEYHFLSLGLEYFILARFAGERIFNPACGNLFHLAFELLLKGYLRNLNKYSIKELKDNFGHNLPKLWLEFKVGTKEEPRLSKFDEIVNELNIWEDIRYLDFSSKISGIEIRPGHSYLDPDHTNRVKAHVFAIHLDDMDELFKEVMIAAKVNPKDLIQSFSLHKGLDLYKKNNRHDFFENP